MISLICTNCKAALSIDDAFAGGVCRCGHCGTIQTVPSHLKKSSKPNTASPGDASRMLYQKQSRPETLGTTGLAELADVVASSGLTSGRLRAATIPGTGGRARLSPRIVLGAVIALLVVMGLILWLISGPTSRESGNGGASSAASVAAARSPEFCGTRLDDRVIVYVLDRGNATSEYFDRLKQACFRSVESLGPDRKFQIIFWNNGSDAAYPNASPTFASTANLEAARRALEDITAHGQSEVTSALKKAVASNPGTIVLATAKGYELDDGFVDAVQKIRGNSNTKIFTFAVGAGDPGSALKSIATRTGGRFTAVPPSTLREAAE